MAGTSRAAAEVDDPWSDVVGQDAAVDQLRAAAADPVHAYLFVGPGGSGKRAAARAFAAEILRAGLPAGSADRVVRLALAEQHPDLVVIEPDGTIFRFPDPRKSGSSPGLRLVQEVMASPVEAPRKVVVAVDFHLARDEAVGKLLKIVEEPPETAVVVLLAEEIPPEQVTIASRCARVDFGPLPPAAVLDRLTARGVAPELAEVATEAAGGDLGRAELLASDARLKARFDAWRSVPSRLDGRGATVVALVDEVRAHLDQAQEPLDRRHAGELEALDEQAEVLGQRPVRRGDVTDRQKREVRQLRTDELRFGLATLARPYRDRLATVERPESYVDSLQAIQRAAEALERNPIEELLLESLLLRLAPLPA